MKTLLADARFDFLSQEDKDFIVDFDTRMTQLGYDAGGTISNGYCWGKYMLIYTRTGVKQKNVVARIYLRDSGIALRLFFSNIDRHHTHVERAPRHIKDAFTSDAGRCNHCRETHRNGCMFRKRYVIDGVPIEKCSGWTFEFPHPGREQLADYLALITEFYPRTRRAAGEQPAEEIVP